MNHEQQPPNSGEPEDPDTEIIQKDCTTCAQKFDTQAFVCMGKAIAQHRTCPDCRKAEEDAKKTERRGRIRDARTARFAVLAGPYYTSPEIRAAMPVEMAKACRALVQAGRGVMAHGLSGKFKTTCMLNGAVKWLVLEGHEVTYMTAATWRQRTAAAAREGRTEAFLRDLKRVPWLFLDDIGNMQGNETAAEALNDLLEARVHAGKLPILVTTQYSGAALQNRFPSPEIGLAIGRRLALLATPVDFDK